MRKQQISIVILALWLTIVSVFMILWQQIDLEIFFVLFMIGVLAIVYVMEPAYIQHGYLRYVWYLIGVGAVIFGLIIVHRGLEILGLEIII